MPNPGVTAPTRLGRYELLARLATGGMGEIFLARLEGAEGFEKLFVVKRILPHLADDARFRAMLIAEARIASKLTHANICQVYELGETDGQLYIVMEYLEGITILPLLRKASKDGTPLDFGFIGGVIQQATDGLHYAHELRDRSGESLGIVHRDVTPGNVFLTDAGVVKVLDFGIAKVKDASAHTQTGTVKGKYAYMAPEQLRGISVDRRADVFALGVVIYEMLALRRLFQRTTDYLTFRAVMEQPIPDVRRYRPDLPDRVAEALARALDREPTNRFDSARQLGTVMIEALSTVRRPWTQGEIGDFVGSNFAAEITKRSEQVSTAIHRTPPSGLNGRPTMPLIPADDAIGSSPGDDDDDDGFPSVESSVSDAPADVRPVDFQIQTPPPFGADSQISGTRLHPQAPPVAPAASSLVGVATQRAPSPSPHAAPPRRNLVWPMLAIAMVAIASAALFLVWRQMQQQPPAVVNITSEPANNVPPPPPVQLAEEPVRPGSDVKPPPGKGSSKPPARLTVKRISPYDEAIQSNRSKITQCAQAHGAPPSNARVTIVVTTTGKAKNISLQPPDLDGSPLGACIKSVLSLAKYPSAQGEMQVSVALKAS
jgi:serine/threonine-protein kinase